MAGSNHLRILSRNIGKQITCVRTLYSVESLGMPKYEEARAAAEQSYMTDRVIQRFKTRIAQEVNSDSKVATSKDDVVKMLHLASESEQDTQLVTKLLQRLQKQKGTYDFHFGPIIMRYYYYSGKPVEALKAFCDPAFDGLFDDISSLKVFVTLLYKYNMHEELLDVFEVVKAKKNEDVPHLKTLGNVVLASCYRKNTPESYKYALDLVRNNKEKITRRGLVLVATMALKNRDPGLALDLLSSIDFSNNVCARNLKVMAYSMLDMSEDALRVIKRDLFRDVATPLVPEAFQALKESVYRIKDENLKDFIVPELKHLEADLKEKGYLVEENLDNYLLQPIKSVQKRSAVRRRSRDNEAEADLDD